MTPIVGFQAVSKQLDTALNCSFVVKMISLLLDRKTCVYQSFIAISG